MPFHDLDKGLPAFDCNNFDVTIVGAGAVGILLAVKLAAKGKSVLLLETGHFEIDDDRQALNEVVNTAKVLTSAVWGRKRAVGGTTLAWGGQSLPFSELDFLKKEWVENSGWPISYQDIEAYYPVANAFMGIDGLNYSTDIFQKIKVDAPEFNDDSFQYHLSKWANEPNFQKLYKADLERNVMVIYNSTLKKINKDDAGRVTDIDIISYSFVEMNLKVNQLVIAAGAIETSRIVLLNQLFDKRNETVAGKYFMEHPCCEVGEINTENSYRLQKYFNTHVWQGRKYSIRLSSSREFQMRERMLNCSASVLFKPAEGKPDLYGQIKSLLKKFSFSTALQVSRSAPTILKAAVAYYKDKFFYKIGSENKLVLMVEQEPLAESYISLSDQPDRFGMPKAIVNWEISRKTWETVCKINECLKIELQQHGFGTVTIYPQFHLENPDWKALLSDVNHHMGGCRMGANQETSIVDRNLKVWGTENLFLCGCAVFPTSSHSNPTLTALALGARLADHLTNSSAS